MPLVSWRAVVTNTGAQLLAKTSTALATFVLLGFIARRFGIEGVGVFSLTMTAATIAFMVIDWGMNAVVIQRFKQERIILQNALGGRFILALLVAFSLVSVTLLLGAHPRTSPGFPPLFRIGILILLPALFFQAVFFTVGAIFQYQLRYIQQAVAIGVGSVTSLIFATALFIARAPLPFYFIAPLLTSGISALLAVRLESGGRTHLFAQNARLQGSFHLLWETAPLALLLLFTVFYARLDVFLLTVYRGLHEVGNYSVATTIMTNILVIPVFMTNTLYPQLVRLRGDPTFWPSVWTAGVRLFVLGLLTGLAGWIGGPLVIQWWVGADFSSAQDAVRILSFGFPVYFLSALTMAVLILLSQRWLLVGIYALGFLVNAAGNVLYQPVFGYRAAAWLTVGVECIILSFSMIAIILFFRQRRKGGERRRNQ